MQTCHHRRLEVIKSWCLQAFLFERCACRHQLLFLFSSVSPFRRILLLHPEHADARPLVIVLQHLGQGGGGCHDLSFLGRGVNQGQFAIGVEGNAHVCDVQPRRVGRDGNDVTVLYP